MSDAPRPGSVEYRVQRWLLVELVTAPLSEGHGVDRLTVGLGELRPDVDAGIDALIAVGLAERGRDMVRATPAAVRFDALWPSRA